MQMPASPAPAASPARASFQVGDWAADPATNELRRGTEAVRIEPRAMDLLVVLAGRAGQVVSREALLAAAWPGVVVGDEALTQAITRLRRALGDDPRAPTYIETISKRGYRLKAPVQGETPAAAGGPRARRAGRLAWLALLPVLALVGYLAISRVAAPPVAGPAAGEADEGFTTVTVLPFEPIGTEGDGQSYFARGIGDSLMTELGRLASLRVISASGLPGSEAARRARYVVAGSVMREAGTLRIHVRLLDARSNLVLWSERFERPMGELFAVQDEIIRRVTESLPARVSESERQRLARRHTRSLEAYDHFLRAQELFLVRGARENAEAREHYRRALEVDPRFARAYAGLALTHALDHRLQVNADARAGLDRALELAESARLIDPELAEVHWAIGFVHAQARRHREAIAALERAIALNPSFADAHAMIGGIHTYVGEPAKSIPPLRAALRLKPDGGYLYYLLLGRAYLFENDLEQALINLRQALARNPADVEVRLYLAAALAAAGERAAAEWEIEEVRAIDRAFSMRAWLESYPLTSAPHRERLRELVARAGLE